MGKNNKKKQKRPLTTSNTPSNRPSSSNDQPTTLNPPGSGTGSSDPQNTTNEPSRSDRPVSRGRGSGIPAPLAKLTGAKSREHDTREKSPNTTARPSGSITSGPTNTLKSPSNRSQSLGGRSDSPRGQGWEVTWPSPLNLTGAGSRGDGTPQNTPTTATATAPSARGRSAGRKTPTDQPSSAPIATGQKTPRRPWNSGVSALRTPSKSPGSLIPQVARGEPIEKRPTRSRPSSSAGPTGQSERRKLTSRIPHPRTPSKSPSDSVASASASNTRNEKPSSDNNDVEENVLEEFEEYLAPRPLFGGTGISTTRSGTQSQATSPTREPLPPSPEGYGSGSFLDEMIDAAIQESSGQEPLKGSIGRGDEPSPRTLITSNIDPFVAGTSPSSEHSSSLNTSFRNTISPWTSGTNLRIHEKRVPLDDSSNENSPTKSEGKEKGEGSDDGSEAAAAASGQPASSSAGGDQSGGQQSYADPVGGRFPGDDGGYGGLDAVFAVPSGLQGTPGPASDRVLPTLATGPPLATSPPTAPSDEVDYIKQLAELEAQDARDKVPPFDPGSLGIFNRFVRPEETSPANDAFVEYSKSRWDQECVQLAYAALEEFRASATEHVGERLHAEQEKETLEHRLMQAEQAVANLRAVQDRNDPNAGYKQKKIKDLTNEILDWEQKFNEKQRDLERAVRKRRDLEEDIRDAQEQTKKLRRDYNTLGKHVKGLLTPEQCDAKLADKEKERHEQIQKLHKEADKLRSEMMEDHKQRQSLLQSNEKLKRDRLELQKEADRFESLYESALADTGAYKFKLRGLEDQKRAQAKDSDRPAGMIPIAESEERHAELKAEYEVQIGQLGTQIEAIQEAVKSIQAIPQLSAVPANGEIHEQIQEIQNFVQQTVIAMGSMITQEACDERHSQKDQDHKGEIDFYKDLLRDIAKAVEGIQHIPELKIVPSEGGLPKQIQEIQKIVEKLLNNTTQTQQPPAENKLVEDVLDLVKEVLNEDLDLSSDINQDRLLVEFRELVEKISSQEWITVEECADRNKDVVIQARSIFDAMQTLLEVCAPDFITGNENVGEQIERVTQYVTALHQTNLELEHTAASNQQEIDKLNEFFDALVGLMQALIQDDGFDSESADVKREAVLRNIEEVFKLGTNIREQIKNGELLTSEECDKRNQQLDATVKSYKEELEALKHRFSELEQKAASFGEVVTLIKTFFEDDDLDSDSVQTVEDAILRAIQDLGTNDTEDQIQSGKLITSAKCNERHKKLLEDLKGYQNGLDKLMQKVPQEMHTESRIYTEHINDIANYLDFLENFSKELHDGHLEATAIKGKTDEIHAKDRRDLELNFGILFNAHQEMAKLREGYLRQIQRAPNDSLTQDYRILAFDVFSLNKYLENLERWFLHLTEDLSTGRAALCAANELLEFDYLLDTPRPWSNDWASIVGGNRVSITQTIVELIKRIREKFLIEGAGDLIPRYQSEEEKNKLKKEIEELKDQIADLSLHDKRSDHNHDPEAEVEAISENDTDEQINSKIQNLARLAYKCKMEVEAQGHALRARVNTVDTRMEAAIIADMNSQIQQAYPILNDYQMLQRSLHATDDKYTQLSADYAQKQAILQSTEADLKSTHRQLDRLSAQSRGGVDPNIEASQAEKIEELTAQVKKLETALTVAKEQNRLEKRGLANEAKAAEESWEYEKDALRAKIRRLENSRKKAEDELKQQGSRKERDDSDGNDDGQRGRGDSGRYVELKTNFLCVDFSIARCELALRQMASNRAAYGFSPHDTDEAIEASRDAISLSENLPGNDNELTLSRAYFWAGVAYYYADDELKANVCFKNALGGLRDESVREGGFLRAWVSGGTSYSVPKDAVLYRRAGAGRRRTSSSTILSPPKKLRRKKDRGGEEERKKRKSKRGSKKSGGLEASSSKSSRKKKGEKSKKTQQSHPPKIEEESDEDQAGVITEETSNDPPADTSTANDNNTQNGSNTEGVATQIQQLTAEDDNIYDDSTEEKKKASKAEP